MHEFRHGEIYSAEEKERRRMLFMSDESRAYADVWDEGMQAYVFTDITQGIHCTNHGDLDAAEAARQCVIVCVECHTETAVRRQDQHVPQGRGRGRVFVREMLWPALSRGEWQDLDSLAFQTTHQADVGKG